VLLGVWGLELKVEVSWLARVATHRVLRETRVGFHDIHGCDMQAVMSSVVVFYSVLMYNFRLSLFRFRNPGMQGLQDGHHGQVSRIADHAGKHAQLMHVISCGHIVQAAPGVSN
jgi:hypothetical protein